MDAFLDSVWNRGGIIGRILAIGIGIVLVLVFLAILALGVIIIGLVIWSLLIVPARAGDFDGSVYKHYSALNTYKGSETAIVLPAVIEDKPVTIISNMTDESGLVEEIIIPDDLIPVTDAIIPDFPSLQRYTVSDNHPTLMVIDGALYTKDGKTLLSYPQGRTGEAVIPEGVEVIASGAFRRSSASAVSLPDSLRTISPFAMGDFRVQVTVEIPAGVTAIDANAFTDSLAHSAATQLIVTPGSPAHDWAQVSNVPFQEASPAPEAAAPAP